MVERCPPRYEEAVEVRARFVMGDFTSVLNQLSPIIGSDGPAFLHAFNRAVVPLPDTTAMSQLLAQHDGGARVRSGPLVTQPLILTTTWTQLPFEYGLDTGSPEGAVATKALIRPAVLDNLLGLPSACVPAGLDMATGLPIGVLLTGRRLREDLCLDAVEAVEIIRGLQTPIAPIA